MPYLQQTRDLTKQYLAFGRILNDWRPVANTSYLPGMVVATVPLDQQIYPDQGTVAPTPITGTPAVVIGAVSETWNGFSGAGLPQTFLSPASNLAVGSRGVTVNEQGYHPGVLIDNSGAGAVAITNGVLLIPSKGTAGYAQGATAIPAVGNAGVVGNAMLPASGIGSSLGAGALVQASQTATIATPVAGDVINLTLQIPYSQLAPGVVQTATYSMAIAPAATPTSAAAAFVAQLNATPGFAQFYTASNAAGVITIAVNTSSSPFQITFGSGITVLSAFSVGLSGTVGNSISIACSVTGAGGTTFVAGGATLAGGTGFKGPAPCFVDGAAC